MKKFSTEADARIVIDDLLRQAGWEPADKSQVLTEISIRDMTWIVAEPVVRYRVQSATKTKDGDEISTGRADYVLLNRRGRPPAIIEAKRSAIEPYTAKQQALPYAKKIAAPFIFLTNGEIIY
ncbi:MAG: restriction endonuclease subunit R, partial [Deltaproteobacteria bacterium]